MLWGDAQGHPPPPPRRGPRRLFGLRQGRLEPAVEPWYASREGERPGCLHTSPCQLHSCTRPACGATWHAIGLHTAASPAFALLCPDGPVQWQACRRCDCPRTKRARLCWGCAPGVKRQAERLAPAEVWTLALGFGLAILAQRVAGWLQVTMHRHTMV